MIMARYIFKRLFVEIGSFCRLVPIDGLRLYVYFLGNFIIISYYRLSLAIISNRLTIIIHSKITIRLILFFYTITIDHHYFYLLAAVHFLSLSLTSLFIIGFDI